MAGPSLITTAPYVPGGGTQVTRDPNQSKGDAFWNGERSLVRGADNVNSTPEAAAFWKQLGGQMNNWMGQFQGYGNQAGQAAQGMGALQDPYAQDMAGYQSQMNPLAGILAGLGGQAQGLGQAYGQDMQGLSAQLNPYQGIFGDLANRMAGMTDSYANLANNIDNATRGDATDPEAFMRSFMSWQPQLQQTAERTTESMFGEPGTTSTAYAQEASRQAREAAAAQFADSGMLNSGAAVQSMTEAGILPTLQAAQEMALARGNMTSQLAGNLYGTGMSGLQSSYQALPGQLAALFGAQGDALNGQLAALQAAQGGYGAGMGVVSEQMNQRGNQYQGQLGGLNQAQAGYGGAADILNQLMGQRSQTFANQLGAYGGQADIYNQLASMFGNLFGQGLGLQGDYAMPMYMQGNVMQGTGAAPVVMEGMKMAANA
jgi:hypothetical protein